MSEKLSTNIREQYRLETGEYPSIHTNVPTWQYVKWLEHRACEVVRSEYDAASIYDECRVICLEEANRQRKILTDENGCYPKREVGIIEQSCGSCALQILVAKDKRAAK